MNITDSSPAITDDFGTFNDISWYASAYLITATAFQPTWGKIYQIFNLRAVYILIMVIFFVGSLLSAVAPNSVALIIGRALAGLGCSGQLSGALTIIAYSVPQERRAIYQGVLGSCYGVGP